MDSGFIHDVTSIVAEKIDTTDGRYWYRDIKIKTKEGRIFTLTLITHEGVLALELEDAEDRIPDPETP